MSGAKHKLTKAEAFAAMSKELKLDRLEKAMSNMSDEEIYADLEKRGLPRDKVNAIFAKQDAKILEAEARRSAKTPKLADVVPFRRRFGGGVFVGFGTAAALAALALVAIGLPHSETDAGSITVDRRDRPTQLRDLAFIECRKGHWESCMEKLDEAQGIDPASDSLPEVKDARARAAAALHPEEEYDAYATQNNGRKRPPKGYDGGGNVP